MKTMRYPCLVSAAFQMFCNLRASHSMSTSTANAAVARTVPDSRQRIAARPHGFDASFVFASEKELDGGRWPKGHDDFQEAFNLEDSVTTGILELQRSTGSDVMDSRLQQQLDNISHPNQFLDRHVGDATPIEKLAMMSITQQLPKGAVDILVAKSEESNHVNSQKKTKKTRMIGRQRVGRTKSNSDLPPALQYATVRVSPEEEVELARIIRRGASLEAAKEKAETAGRELSRQEWAKLVGLSPRELRREIAQYRQAKHLLVNANLGLVGTVVNQYWYRNKNRLMGLSKEELIQEGSLGLLRAAELFDPSRGLRFSTYAVVWIKGVLSNSRIQEFVRVPDRERRRWRKIQQVHSDLEKEMEPKAITIDKLSQATGLSPADILFTQRKMQQSQHVLSLDYEQSSQSRSGTETSWTGQSALHNDRAMQEEDLVEQTQLQADIVAAMTRNLDTREARLMRLRYGLSDGVTRSLTECAEAMGLSYTRVQHLSVRCLKKLREAAEAESLQEYLHSIA